jgi:hypothetical protein
MSVRVRDLEIALVLAREMKAAAARSVDASLRLDQLQEVFGVEHLDPAERARIQTALQMAGLEPFPSLLEADPSEPIRFGAANVAAGATARAGAGAATAAGADEPAPAPPEEPPEEEPPTFPTVGQFARSKLGRSRRFGVRRGDHGEHGARGVPEPEPEPVPEPELEPEAEAEPELEAELELEPEPEPPPDEAVGEEPVAELQDEQEQEHPHEPEDEREYIPLVAPEEVAPPDEYAATTVHEQPPAVEQPARADELVAALLPAVAIPVIVTSVAGWQFGLPFVALSVIATGIVLGRRSQADGPRRGLRATLRGSPAAATVLKSTAIVTVLSVVASVVLASAGKDSSPSTSQKAATPAKKPQGPVATRPSTPAKPATKKKARSPKHKTSKHKPTAASNGPAPDPATRGLVRVPPRSSVPPQGTGPNGTGTTQPSTGTPPSPGTGGGTGTQPSGGARSGTGAAPGSATAPPTP